MENKEQALFKENQNVTVTYNENSFDDYAREILLPYKLSTLGPVVAKADVNGDGIEDFYLGGAVGHSGQLYIQLPGWETQFDIKPSI